MPLGHIRGPLNLTAITVHTAAGDVTIANETIVVVNKASGAATGVTLPRPGSAAGRVVMVKDGKGDAATNNITVSTSGGLLTIDGAASYVISENYGKAWFFFNGTEWNAMSSAEVSAAEVGYLNGVTAGTAAASKALVLGASGEIATITTLTATTGNLTTANIAGILTLSNVTTTAAAGSVIANAAAISSAVNVVTGADDTKGVVLPTAVAGKVMVVYSNQATNGLKIYPPVNGTINDGSANAAITIEGKTAAIFVGTSATNWAALFTANA